MSKSLDLKDVELDYEAEEAEDQVEISPRRDNDTPGLEPRTEADTGEMQEPEEGQEAEGDKTLPGMRTASYRRHSWLLTCQPGGCQGEG